MDREKTREQLMDELAVARQRIADLEAARADAQSVERALRESEERFRVALKNSHLVVYNQDRDLRYTWIYNPQLGYTLEGILGKTDAELLLPEDAARLDEIKRGVLESGVGARETVRTVIEGKAYYYDLTVEPVRDATGEIVGVTGASRDITDRRQVEEALRERTHELNERVKELNCLYGISRLRETPGISLEEHLQGTVELIRQAWQYPEITATRIVLEGQEYCTEGFPEESPCQQCAEIFIHGRHSGSVEVCYLEARPESDEGPFLKEERHLLNAIAERLGRITEHKRTEEEHQAILRTAIDGFWLCNTEGQILDVNDSLCHMLGYAREELLRLSVPDVEAVETPEEVAQHIEKVIASGHDRFESRLRGKDGRIVDTEASVSYLDSAGGRFFAFLRDITQRKRIERALQQAYDGLESRVQERTAELEGKSQELERTHQREAVLNALLRISMEEVSLDEQMERALDKILAVSWLPVQRQGGIFLVGDDPNVLELRAQRGLSPALLRTCARVSFGQCVCGRAAASGQTQFASTVDERHETHYDGMEPHGHYCVPILSGDRAIGTLVLYLKEGHQRELQEEDFLQAVAHTLAGMIERKHAESQRDAMMEALWRSQVGLAEAQRIAHVGNWDWDIGANSLYWSDEIYRIFGLAPQEFGATYEAFLNSVHPDDRVLVQRAVDEALHGTKPYGIDHRIVLPDASERIVHEQAEVTCDQSGRPVRMVGTVQDITERKRAENALRQSEQRLRVLNEQLEDYGRNLEHMVALRTREIEQRQRVAGSLRDILAVLNSNRPVDEILRHIVTEASQLLGSDTSAIYHQADSQGAFTTQTAQGLSAEVVAGLELPPGFRRALQKAQTVSVSDVVAALPDLVAADPSGVASLEGLAQCSRAMLAVPLVIAGEVYGGLALYYAEPRDFSEEEIGLAVTFADQAALALENARLHQQAEKAAVLAERGRLARDLHDSVTQSLYSITLLAEGWKRLSTAGKLADSDEPLTELGVIAQQALKEMRLMVHELRPPDLETEGLLGALHLRLGTVEKRAGVEARLVTEDLVELPPLLEEGLYRIATEALNNALKHAEATQVTVFVRTRDDSVELEIVDDGRGFDASSLDQLRGVGLDSMRERAEQMGGTLTIDSEPLEGTRVCVSVEAPQPTEAGS